jgi:hypothetical protein
MVEFPVAFLPQTDDDTVFLGHLHTLQMKSLLFSTDFSVEGYDRLTKTPRLKAYPRIQAPPW